MKKNKKQKNGEENVKLNKGHSLERQNEDGRKRSYKEEENGKKEK
jgi:hypothetical protein